MRFSFKEHRVRFGFTRAEWHQVTGMDRLDYAARASITLTETGVEIRIHPDGPHPLRLDASVNGPVPMGMVNRANGGFVALVMSTKLALPGQDIPWVESPAINVACRIEGDTAHVTIPRRDAPLPPKSITPPFIAPERRNEDPAVHTFRMALEALKQAHQVLHNKGIQIKYVTSPKDGSLGAKFLQEVAL